jgi:osmotically-inducible protein OsmY
VRPKTRVSAQSSDVEEELQCQPELDAKNIAVSIKDGVLTLTGFVRRYRDKYEAERAVKQAAGVIELANDIDVRPLAIDEKPDPEIARDVLVVIRNQVPDLSGNIRAVARNGWVNLEGETEWQRQRLAGEQAVRWLANVKGITNCIRARPMAAPDSVERTTPLAIKRNARLDQSRIAVEADGGQIARNGTVRSWRRPEEADRVAWSAPGVTKVETRSSWTAIATTMIKRDCDVEGTEKRRGQ